MRELKDLPQTAESAIAVDAAHLIQAAIPKVQQVIFYGSKTTYDVMPPEDYGQRDIDMCFVHNGSEEDSSIWTEIIATLTAAGYGTGFSEPRAIHVETVSEGCFSDPSQLLEQARVRWVENVQKKGFLLFDRSEVG